MMRFIEWVGGFSNAYGNGCEKKNQTTKENNTATVYFCLLRRRRRRKTTQRQCSCSRIYLAACLRSLRLSSAWGSDEARTRVVQVGPAFNSQLSALIATAASPALLPAEPRGPFLLPESHCDGFVPRHSCCSAASDSWSWMSSGGELDSRRGEVSAGRCWLKLPSRCLLKSPPPSLAGRENGKEIVKKGPGNYILLVQYLPFLHHFLFQD